MHMVYLIRKVDSLYWQVRPKRVEIYADAKGCEPFSAWLANLKDTTGRQRILARLRRIEQENYGDCKALGEGVLELRMNFGPGYRVYFAEKGATIVILLCGGDKNSQQQDIKTAKSYWKEYCDHA